MMDPTNITAISTLELMIQTNLETLLFFIILKIIFITLDLILILINLFLLQMIIIEILMEISMLELILNKMKKETNGLLNLMVKINLPLDLSQTKIISYLQLRINLDPMEQILT